MRQIKITKAFRDALREAINEIGSQVAFGEKAGMRQNTLSKILSGQTGSMLDTNYEKLYKAIEDKLPPEERIKAKNSTVFNGVNGNIYNNHNPDHISKKELINSVMGSSELISEEKLKFIQIINNI